MDIRDYLRMLRRGWPVVLALAAVFLGVAALYVAVTPKVYQATAVLYVTTNDPASVTDLQLGAQFSANAITTYADIIDSVAVLGPVATGLRPQVSPDTVLSMVSASARPQTSLIDITATGTDPQQVQAIAAATAVSATRILPALETSQSGQSLIRIQQIRPATQPSQPISPNVKRILVLGFVVGLCLGLGTAIATQALDTRIRRVRDVGLLTELPILAVLPRVKRSQQHALLTPTDRSTASADAFRTLRTNLRFVEVKEQRSLVVTAIADGADGAHVPANLAWMLAEAGNLVLLVDVDLRDSAVEAAMRMAPAAGLAELLTGQVDLSDAIRPTDHQNLQVVLAGATPPNPSELLSAPLMTTTLRRMKSKYDYIVLHAPALLSNSDAAVVSRIAGGTLVTVTIGRTRAQEVAPAMTVLTNVGVRPLGLVLTRTGKSALDHRNPRTRPGRRRSFRHGRAMRHRFEWDWRKAIGTPMDSDEHTVTRRVKRLHDASVIPVPVAVDQSGR